MAPAARVPVGCRTGNPAHPPHPALRSAGGGPLAAAPHTSSAASARPPAPPPAPPQQRGKSRHGAFERRQGAALPAPAHTSPRSLAPRHGWVQPPAPGSPVLGTWALPVAGTGGRASAGKRTPRAGGRPAEPSRAGNGGHASCHRRLGSAPAPPVPAPAPSEGLAPSLPLCPRLGLLLAQPSPACASRAFPTLRLAGLGLSREPALLALAPGVPAVPHWGPAYPQGAGAGSRDDGARGKRQRPQAGQGPRQRLCSCGPALRHGQCPAGCPLLRGDAGLGGPAAAPPAAWGRQGLAHGGTATSGAAGAEARRARPGQPEGGTRHRTRRAVPGPSELNPLRRAGLCQATLCRRRAQGTCPLLPAEGRRGRRPPAQGPIPTPAAPCAWAAASWGCLGRRLGTAPEQPAAEPPQPLPSRPDRQGRRQPPLKLGAGQRRPPGMPAPPPRARGHPPAPARSPSRRRPGSARLAGAGASGLGAIKPSGRQEPSGSDSPRWD